MPGDSLTVARAILLASIILSVTALVVIGVWSQVFAGAHGRPGLGPLAMVGGGALVVLALSVFGWIALNATPRSGPSEGSD